ncbi:hypothetical protein KQX54_021741 [Cotesia glomerata]|uniref:Uncharacterized protein n=1 Tax=Cotesia glomerata TaxID=32391 RepID=A0AAV7J7D6_COTGL|nr:hypothetical protein KQX54_021741 [Cotesia glomerata]
MCDHILACVIIWSDHIVIERRDSRLYPGDDHRRQICGPLLSVALDARDDTPTSSIVYSKRVESTSKQSENKERRDVDDYDDQLPLRDSPPPLPPSRAGFLSFFLFLKFLYLCYFIHIEFVPLHKSTD